MLQKPGRAVKPALISSRRFANPPVFFTWWTETTSKDPGFRKDASMDQAVRELADAYTSWTRRSRRRRAAGGVYIYGPVGRGKTMVMKQFANYLKEAANTRVLQCHFADFMLMIHALLRSSSLRDLSPEEIITAGPEQLRATGNAVYLAGDEGLEFIARKLAAYTHLLIDEININNISDAMLFKRVMNRLWRQGTFAVMTSNVPPKRLYEGGLNRSQFVDFIEELESSCSVVNLDGKYDHRLQARGDGTGSSGSILRYNVPAPPLASLIDRLEQQFDGGQGGARIPVLHGRHLKPRWLSPDGKEALFTFDDLCRSNCAPSDFISLAAQLRRRLLLTDIPSLSVDEHGDELRRFITLVDVFYEREIPVAYFAAAAPLLLISGVADQQIAALAALDAHLDTKNLTCAAWWLDQFQSDSDATGDEEGWVRALTPIMRAELSRALWRAKKYESMTLANLQGLLALYRIFGRGITAGAAGVPRELLSLFSAGLFPPTAAGPTEVRFAIPRLVSRLLEAAAAHNNASASDG